MDENRVNRAANKILFLTKREELLIAEKDQDKVIDTLFEEERQAFTNKIRTSLEEEARYLEDTIKNSADSVKTELYSKLLSLPDETQWLPNQEKMCGVSLKDVNVKELKSKGVELVYTKNSFQLKEPKAKEKSKRKYEDKEDAKLETDGNAVPASVPAAVHTTVPVPAPVPDPVPALVPDPVPAPVPAADNADSEVNVNGGSGTDKVLRKRRRI